MAEKLNLQPCLILGDAYRDYRGEVRHVNGFGFENVDRFYSIHPKQPGEVRGWVGHRRDWKWFYATIGSFVVGVVALDDWKSPAPSVRQVIFRLQASVPAVLAVPPGHFTVCRAIEPDRALMVFSSGRIADAASDDYRLPPDYWALREKETKAE